MPAGVPARFMLVKTQNLRDREHVSTRREYRDARDRLLVYLLGVQGEIGEGAEVAEQVMVFDDTKATLLGGPGGNWALTWNDRFPCEQMSVVGNGFSRREFEAVMIEIGLLRPARSEDATEGYVEWIAVFDAARRPEGLDPSTEDLLATAGMDHIAVAQASCWKGLPARLGIGLSAYVAAVYGPSRAELEKVVEAVGRQTIFRGELPSFCVD